MPTRVGDVHVDDGFPGDGATLFERMSVVADDPLYALDPDRRFVAVNENLVTFTGRPPESLLGEHVRVVLADDAGLRALDLMAAKVAGEDTTMAGEFEVVTAEGTPRLCELEVTALDPGAGDETIVGTSRDVTGARRREERLEVLDRVLRHNLRNKIGTVLGYVNMLLEATDDPETRSMAETARSEAEELLAISNKARRFHRLLDLEPTRTTVADLETVVGPVLRTYRENYPAATFELVAVDHDPIVVDEELLEAAIDEVIGNAVEHHDAAAPTVEVRVAESEGQIAVDVADDGPGIDPGERQAILSGEEEPLYHASGLGIWLVKWAMQLTGGELDIRENEPRGTVVTLILPRPSSDRSGRPT